MIRMFFIVGKYRLEIANFTNTKLQAVTEPEETVAEAEQKQPIQQEVKLNDTTMRLVGIPFFGIAIPNLSGLFGNLAYTDVRYWLGYVYFILLALLIWQGNRYLLFRTRKRFTWFDKPIEKLVLLFMNNIFYTTPLTVAWLCMWYNFAGFSEVKWNTILIVALVNVICVLFVTHVYETVFMVKEQQNEQVKNAELQRAKAEAELSALKNQIDPHFMFNSLNTLTYLIKADSQKALAFTENLAEVYRYILSQKDQTLVLLDDELDFTHKYTDLLHLRFGQALIIRKKFNGTAGKEFLIPPTSVFVAFENAVKHNEISERMPMEIDVDVKEGQLIIRNSLRERKTRAHSSRIGLKNLDERFKLVTGKGITATHNETHFVVQLPLIPIAS
ncbi:MAG: sensor histidine kinase [Bacteroidota bacterium]